MPIAAPGAKGDFSGHTLPAFRRGLRVIARQGDLPDTLTLLSACHHRSQAAIPARPPFPAVSAIQSVRLCCNPTAAPRCRHASGTAPGGGRCKPIRLSNSPRGRCLPPRCTAILYNGFPRCGSFRPLSARPAACAHQHIGHSPRRITFFLVPSSTRSYSRLTAASVIISAKSQLGDASQIVAASTSTSAFSVA